MRWAKSQLGRVRYPLSGSAIPNVTAAELGIQTEEIRISQRSQDGDSGVLDFLSLHFDVPRERIFVTHGTTLAVYVMAAAVLPPGGEALMESPGYEPLAAAVRSIGGRVSYFSRPFDRGFQPDPAEIAGKLRAGASLVILTNLHNPSGVALAPGVFAEIAAAAEATGAWVLADEVYLEALGAGRELMAARQPGRIISAASVSKVYGLSGIRIGWAIAPAAVVRRAYEIADYLTVETSTAADSVFLKAATRFDALIQRSRAICRERWHIVNHWLASRSGLACVPPAGGAICFPKLPTGASADQLFPLALKRDTLIVPGRFFQADNHFRLGYSLPPADLIIALERLGSALDELEHC